MQGFIFNFQTSAIPLTVGYYFEQANKDVPISATFHLSWHSGVAKCHKNISLITNYCVRL